MTTIRAVAAALRRLGARPVGEATAVFLGYSLVTVAALWPLPAAPHRLGIPNPDVYGNLWALQWVVHQAATDPAHLFDANIYWPHAQSLGFNESLLPQALQVAPILLTGGSALLAYNLLLLVSFPLSGLGAYLLARELTGSRTGAMLAGLGYAFCAYRWDHLVHVHSLSWQWLPLALLYFVRAMASGRARHLVPLGLFTVLQGLSSGYYAVATAVALGLAGAALVAGTPRRRLLKVAGTLLVAGAVIFAGFMPYRATQRRYGFYRSRGECTHWSAGWRSYLDPGELAPLPHLRWLRDRTMTGEPLYPGTPILILAVAGAALARRVRPARLALLWTVAGVLLSLGPDVHLGRVVVPGPFDALRAIPAVQMLRTPARLGVIALVGIGLLAAAACAALRRRAGVARHLPAVLILVAVVEATSPGVGRLFRPIPPPPPTVAWLASAPRAPVLELPWSDAGDGATYAYWSTGHWQPMVNGWGAVEPPGNLGFGLIGGRFPAPYATALLQEHGIVYLVVHVDRLDPGQRGRVLGATALPPGVTLEVDFGADRIYRIDGPRPD